jgi:hypothetical protein
MSVEVIAHLDRFYCDTESDPGGAEPYLWTALVAGDANSFGSGVVTVVAPDVASGAREVIKRGIRAGQQASVPAAQRALGHRFDEGAETPFAGLVAVLLEQDELPRDTMRAGYRKFLTSLETEVGKVLKGHSEPENQQEFLALVADFTGVGGTLRRKIRGAIKESLSFWEKLGVFSGIINKDDNLGFEMAAFAPGLPSSFTLTFEHRVRTRDVVASPSGAPPILGPEREVLLDAYRLAGRFEVRQPASGTRPRQPTVPLPPRMPTRPGTSEP